MTNSGKIVFTAILLILGLGAYFMMRGIDTTEPTPTPTPSPTDNGVNNATTTQPFTSANVRVTSPLPNAYITSPITITGEARGNWFFEASFPVKILDANGKQLGIGIAQAKGEWMTTNFVPFSAPVSFSAPTTPTGWIVFQKDNPSGLPQHDAEVRMPIRFSQVSAQTRDIKLYFYSDQNDRDASNNVLCSAKGLVAVNRTTSLTNTPIQDAIKDLLKGPSALERQNTPGTEFPLPGVTLTSASLSGGVLTLTFSDPQNKTSGGSCRVTVLRAQIEATAKQFAGVSSVRIMPANLFQP